MRTVSKFVSAQVGSSALLWGRLRECAYDTYSNAHSLRDARRLLLAERRQLRRRPSSDATATLRWRQLGFLIQAIEARTGAVRCRV